MQSIFRWKTNANHLPLCSVNTFKALFFGSFGTLDDLLMRLARNEEPAPNVPPPGIVPALASAQLDDADKFVLFGPICCAFSPTDVIELQLFPEAEAAAAAAAAADDDDDDAPRPSFTCWAPILCVVAFDYYSKKIKFDAQSARTHTHTHATKERNNFAKLFFYFFLFNFFCSTFY